MIGKYGSITETLAIRFGLENGRKTMLNNLRPRGCPSELQEKVLSDAMAAERFIFSGDKELLQALCLEEPTEAQWEKVVDRMLVQDYLYFARKNVNSLKEQTSWQ